MKRWIPLFFVLLTGCVAAPVLPPPQRACPPLPTLADNATAAERTAFMRSVVQMYARCAKGE